MSEKEEHKKKHGFLSFLHFTKKPKESKEEKEAKEKEKKEKKEKEKEKKRRSKRVSTSFDAKQNGTPVITTNPPQALLPKKNFDWQESTKRVINEERIESFPIAGDLPRLLKHLRITKELENGEYDVLFPTDDKEYQTNTAGDCFDLIKCITQILEGDEQTKRIEDEWNAVMSNDQDMSVQKTFLMRILSKVFVEEGKFKPSSPVINFLKGVNQKIIANSTLRLKMVCGTMPFKDSHPMFWEIVIVFQDKAYVIHYRKQESISKKPEEYFRFEWELRLVFNNELTQFSEVGMGVSTIEFDPLTKQETRKLVLETLKPICFADFTVTDIDKNEEE
ncbi:hypothetical protein EIN_154730 [Entamoeba invadens IP1]|uniref:Ras guanine nucleotide exchange factor glfB-like C-terminal domain-containing protein n=1 Tax=Entamoeba invadens IP1 TaxID=370355 RepID=A0A0A1UF26_ENTIV|nr:hypothetical protein EIN_154730 [Entamoeba invadens IP1]ELP91396.1 hypothetical protein EIN_154730 [Entamoeba invadens IP1]|eukprot:XP_004258167.1 hypothetical protein EIN_154730 [Entamoeba invadens IP1]